ncbi:MAG: ABC transporter ATP-binding protein/permease, partial [Alphaproteobacteria bacterium]
MKPDIIVMDEATAALDARTQDTLMRRVLETLPESAIDSVGHRTELEAFHDRRLTLARREEGARLVRDERIGRLRPTAGWLVRRLSRRDGKGTAPPRAA